MGLLKKLSLGALLAVAFLGAVQVQSNTAEAAYRQYYSGWSYYPARSYYYRSYYYKPYDAYRGYKYHYTIYYPSRPRYVYYYNPYKQTYWGRYDLESKGYSMLEEKDRKGKLTDIPEEAFPEPGKMPAIPEAEDDVSIEVPPTDVPSNPPQDAPEGAEKPAGDTEGT